MIANPLSIRSVCPLLAGAVFLGVLATGQSSAGDAETAGDGPWTAHIQRLDRALAVKNVSDAEGAWHDAYLAALASRRWEGMVEVGDAALRIGETAKGRKAVEPKARSMYLSALFRARRQNSLDGVLRTGEAFAALGDYQVAEQCAHIAEQLTDRTQTSHGRERVTAFRDRLNGRSVRANKGDLGDPLLLLFPDEVAGP